jgi:outer membrane lipoprotein LolB
LKQRWALLHSFLIFLCALLAACATQSPRSTNNEKTASLANSSWREQGIFSYQDNHHGFSASYIWQNTKDHYAIELMGPLGTGHAKLLVNTKTTLLTTGDGKTFQADNPQLLMEQNLGWSMPVANLKYWLWATPKPNQAFTLKRSTQGDVTQLEQAGWCIQYINYHRFSNYRLPEKIVLTQNNKKIMLVIQNFEKVTP